MSWTIPGPRPCASHWLPAPGASTPPPGAVMSTSSPRLEKREMQPRIVLEATA